MKLTNAPRWSVALFLVALVAPIAPRAVGQEKASAGELAKSLQPFVDSQTLAGAVLLVANQDKTLALETVGFADIAGKQPMRPDSVFWIASMSKPITAAALMILVDEGKVGLDDPIEKFLPEFKDLWVIAEQDGDHLLLKRPKQRPTVRHIMSHTSGMPFSTALEQPTLDGLALRDTVRGYAITPLLWEPGTKYKYSNAGINTGGRIIEVVSGMPYEKFLDKRLFEPLGMKDTTFWPGEMHVARLAKPYKPNADKTGLDETTISQLTYPLSDRRRQPMPGGGLFSTAADVAVFARMMLGKGMFEGKRILSEESVTQLTTRQTAAGIQENYGLGFSVGGGTFGHGGALSTNMTIDPAKNLVLVYLVQHAGYGGTDGGKIHPTFTKVATDLYAK